jgi:stage V sporulation protein AF
MRKLSNSYSENVMQMDRLLCVDENFDMLKKIVKVGEDELTFYYLDGFVKDAVMQKLMLSLSGQKGICPEKDTGEAAAFEFMRSYVVYVETELTSSLDAMIGAVMSGGSLMLGSRFGNYAILIDSRSYPARETAEPQNDRVMRGPRDGFVETLISNTALIRRRIRDTSLRMSYTSVGTESKTDVVLCYMADRADREYVKKLEEKLRSIDVRSLTMGHQSLAESLIKTRWYNPFPKIRITERPDVAAAQLYEGSVILIIDTSPQVMILPTSIFDFLQETNDFYFPPLTGSYVRAVRHIIFWLTLFLVPVWYLMTRYPESVPQFLSFALPKELGLVPIIVQLLIVEFVVDGLKMASMNTPDMLSNSLSVVGGLILGDFAVGLGWLIPEVIILTAFVAIANFSQRSYELGYAFKFMRIMLLILSGLLGIWGFLIGVALVIVLIATNKTINGECKYLYPLIPFNGKALATVLFRVRKKDDVKK